MARTKISEFSSTPANNTDIDSINIAENCPPSGINDAIRELMAQLKDWQSGTSNDPYVVGSSGSLTLNQGTANTVPYLNGSKVVTSGTALSFDGTNLGLGVTPSAWGSGSYKGFQVGGSLSFMGRSGGSDAYVMSNTYFDQTNYRYTASLAASRYTQSGGEHQWFNAPSGTAGNAITFTQAMTLDASGNLGVGTTSPSQRLEVSGGDAKITAAGNGTRNLFFGTSSTNYQTIKYDDSTGALIIGSISSAYPVVFQTQGAERARIDSSGNLLVGTTSAPQAYPTRIAFAGSLAGAGIYSFNSSAGADASFLSKVTNTNCFLVYFDYNNTNVGGIKTNGTSTSYNTTSDYRLKENIAPMTGALATVAQLKPCTYTWKSNGSSGQGFIAHELQSVVQDAVSGEKDGVKEDGTPIYQGVDSSFLVATLTAAIQEQQAIIESLKARLDAANL